MTERNAFDNVMRSCLIVTLGTTTWGGTKKIKQATDDLNKAAGSTALKAVGNLISPKYFEPITAARQAMEAAIEKHTAPWARGQRLLPKNRYETLMDEFAPARDEFYAAARHLATNVYTQARAEAEFELGQYYDPSFYPSPREVLNKFTVSLMIDPVATDADFKRVGLDKAVETAIARDRSAAMDERLTGLVRSQMEYIRELITRVHDQTSDPKKRIFDSLLGNVKEMVDGLADLNVTGDPTIEKLRQEIDDKFGRYDTDDLRKIPEIRQEAHEAAKEIIGTMNGFMKAFGQKEAA